MQLVIRRYGSLIDVSPDGLSPLPPDVAQQLIPHLTYTHKVFQQGFAAYDNVTGSHVPIRFEQRCLYKFEEGRLSTGAGFAQKLTSLLQGAGHRVQLLDISPPRVREDCWLTDWDSVDRNVTFRPTQRECVQAIVAALLAGNGGLVNAAAGYGKTFLFVVLCLLFPKAKIHIVVKPKDVMHRIVRQLTRFVPLVGQVGDGRRDFGRVTVIMADSLHHSDGDCDILLCDEAHQLMAPTYAEAIGRIYRFSRNFAFTATPHGRFDGGGIKIEMFFGPEVFRITYEECVALGLVVPIHVRWLPIRLQDNPCKGKTTTVSKKRWGIWRNWDRNRIIAEDARTYPADQQVLILVETTEHAVFLWNVLREFDLCYGTMDHEEFEGYKSSSLLPPSFQLTDAARRENMRKAFEAGTLKKVIATDVWSTGVDFVQLQTLYRADARESEIMNTQAPCRTSRVYDGKLCSEVIDCADFWDPAYERKSKKRKADYKRLHWTQTWPSGRQISV